jgi:hypothetical protein
MIRFFRNIRQNLLAQGRVTRYLTYAIGEIVLVVIGIFLALQLNNWNAERKRSEQELALLVEMRQNLQRDLADCRGNIASHRRWQRAQGIVLDHLEQRTPFHDSLRYHYGNIFGATQLTANSSAYDNLKSIGFDLVRNDSLRRTITALYAERYPFLANQEMEMDAHMQLVDMGPQMYEKLVVDTVWKSAYPIDVDALMDDNGFKGTLRMNKWIRSFMISQYEDIEGRILKLNAMIDRELDKRSE